MYRAISFSYLFYPSASVPPGVLISGYRRGEGPLLQANAVDSPALDGQEDEATQQGVGHEKGAYPEVYDKALQERMLAGFVGHTAEAQTSHLARRVRLRAFRRSLQGRGVAVVRRLEALVSSVMSNVVLLHPPFFALPTESPSPVSFASIAGYVVVRAHLPFTTYF